MASPTDDQWLTLAPLAAADGELIDGRAWFRLDVTSAAGDTGNAFTVEASLSPDRSDPAPDARLIAYQPTIRWREGGDPTEVRFDAPEGAPLTLQSFDGAEGEIFLVSTFAEQRLPASGQDEWRLAPFTAPGGTAAITLRGGTETPNDVTLALFGRRRPPGRPRDAAAPGPAAPRARWRWRRRARSPTAPRSPSTPPPPPAPARSPSAGASATAQRATPPVIAHPFARPGRYEAELDVLGAGDPGRPRRPRHACPSTSARRPSPTPASRSPPPPASPSPSTAARSKPSDSPLTSYHWTFADGAEADGAAATHAYERPGLYRAVLRVEDASGHPCDFGAATREVTVNFPPVAEAGEAQYAATGQTVTLGGGASYDVDGEVASHRWDMGDGTRLDGATVTHAYAEPGVYTATLTVTDDFGRRQRHRDRHRHHHRQRPAGPRGHRPRPTDRGGRDRSDRRQRLQRRRRRHPLLVLGLRRRRHGRGAAGAVRLGRPRGLSRHPHRHRRQRHPLGRSPPPAIDVTVSAAPVADAGPDQSVAVSEVAFDGGGSSDADGRITSWDWDFGDGATASGRTVRHAYARPGSYEVALVVRDDSGAPLNTARDTMRVRVNAAPIADAGPDLVAAPGEEVILDGSGSVDPDDAVARWTWAFPDGSEAEGERVAHTFPDSGLHRVQLTVRDDDRPAAGLRRRRGRGRGQRPAGRRRRRRPLGRAGRSPCASTAAPPTTRTAPSPPGAGTSTTSTRPSPPPPPSAPGTPPASTPPSSPSPTAAAPPTPPPPTR